MVNLKGTMERASVNTSVRNTEWIVRGLHYTPMLLYCTAPDVPCQCTCDSHRKYGRLSTPSEVLSVLPYQLYSPFMHLECTIVQNLRKGEWFLQEYSFILKALHSRHVQCKPKSNDPINNLLHTNSNTILAMTKKR